MRRLRVPATFLSTREWTFGPAKRTRVAYNVLQDRSALVSFIESLLSYDLAGLHPGSEVCHSSGKPYQGSATRCRSICSCYLGCQLHPSQCIRGKHYQHRGQVHVSCSFDTACIIRHSETSGHWLFSSLVYLGKSTAPFFVFSFPFMLHHISSIAWLWLALQSQRIGCSPAEAGLNRGQGGDALPSTVGSSLTSGTQNIGSSSMSTGPSSTSSPPTAPASKPRTGSVPMRPFGGKKQPIHIVNSQDW